MADIVVSVSNDDRVQLNVEDDSPSVVSAEGDIIRSGDVTREYVKTAVADLKNYTDETMQVKLTAGKNISIEDNIISSTVDINPQIENRVDELEEAAEGNLYDSQIITIMGTQTVPDNALSKAVIISAEDADTVVSFGRNLLNLQEPWNNNGAYQELPLNLSNGNYVLSLDKNICNQDGTPYPGQVYAVYINKAGLTISGQITSVGTVYIGNTGSSSGQFKNTIIPFTVSQPMSLYVYFAASRPKPQNYLEILDTLFGIMQIESGSTPTDRKAYWSNIYPITPDWNGIIDVEPGGRIEYQKDGSVVEVANSVMYKIKKSGGGDVTKQYVANAIDGLKSYTDLVMQPKLIAGTGISIAGDGRTISSGGEWVLRGRIQGEGQTYPGATINIVGCSEVMLKGVLKTSDVVSIMSGQNTLISNMPTGNIALLVLYSDYGSNNIFPIVGKCGITTATDPGKIGTLPNDFAGLCAIANTAVKDFRNIYVSGFNIEYVNIEIYAR